MLIILLSQSQSFNVKAVVKMTASVSVVTETLKHLNLISFWQQLEQQENVNVAAPSSVTQKMWLEVRTISSSDTAASK